MDLSWLIKKVIGEIMFTRMRGRERTNTFRLVDMCKWQRMIPRPQRSPRYQIAHGWKNEYGSWSLSPWRNPWAAREPGEIIMTLFFSFSFFSFWHVRGSLEFFYFILLSYSFFISPRTLICIIPASSPMLRRFLVLEQRGSGVKVGTECLDERQLESSVWSTFLWRVVSILKW
jgi:hypothetical protein